MSRRSEVRRSWLAVMVSDPLRKLLAIGLAVLLWLFLDAQLTKKEVTQVWILTDNRTLQAKDGSRRSLRVQWPQNYQLEWLRDAALVETDPSTDGAASSPVLTDSVQLELVGPTNTLRQLPPDLEFSVFLEPPTNPDSSTVIVEFGINDIRSRGADERIDALLRSMEPARVAVKLEQQGESPPINLIAQNVTVTTPDGTKADQTALRFSQPSVVLRGPANEAQTVKPRFTVNLLSSGTDNGLRGTLALAEPFFDDYELAEPVFVTAPIRPDFLNLTMTVPVLLDTNRTQYAPGQFEAPVPQEIGIAVAGVLRRELTDKSRPQLDEWARRNLRLCAVLPTETTLDGLTVHLGLLFLNPPQRRDGTDYTVTRITPVKVRPKKR